MVQIRRRILRPFLVAHEGRPRRHDMMTDGIFTTKEVGASTTHDRFASFYHEMRGLLPSVFDAPTSFVVNWDRHRRRALIAAEETLRIGQKRSPGAEYPQNPSYFGR